jgi:hypothetical protein
MAQRELHLVQMHQPDWGELVVAPYPDQQLVVEVLPESGQCGAHGRQAQVDALAGPDDTSLDHQCAL